jgi:hypothetical protein
MDLDTAKIEKEKVRVGSEGSRQQFIAPCLPCWVCCDVNYKNRCFLRAEGKQAHKETQHQAVSPCTGMSTSCAKMWADGGRDARPRAPHRCLQV